MHASITDPSEWQKKIKAVLLMGGKGSRFKSFLPKQFHLLSGKKIYLHTLERFLASQFFEQIILVCHKDWLAEVEKDIQAYPFAPLQLVIGGETRQESSYLGLLACGSGTEYVVIHDAVRPFISQEILEQNILQCIKWEAVDTCIASADTIVHSKNGGQITEIPTRAEYLRGQTPQSFLYAHILSAHTKARELCIENASDDCSLLLKMGHNIHIVKGEETNIKITTELDLFVAEQLFRTKEQSPISLSSSSSLKGKVFLVTGGTGGIGQCICALLEKEGATAIAISRSACLYPADLSHREEAARIFKKIEETHGVVDGLINSIGYFKLESFASLSVSEIEKQIAVNLKSLLFSCKYARLKKKAHILNIASSAYSKGRKGFSIYSCTKAAVVNFTQALAEEHPEHCINVLVPQRTHTPMRISNFPNEDPNTLLPPEEVAQAAIQLLKENKITSSIIEVRKK